MCDKRPPLLLLLLLMFNCLFGRNIVLLPRDATLRRSLFDRSVSKRLRFSVTERCRCWRLVAAELVASRHDPNGRGVRKHVL